MSATADLPRHRAWGVAAMGLILAGASLSAGDEPRRQPTPEQVREKLARVRSDLQRRRAAMGHTNANTRPAPGAGRRPASRPSVDRGLQYRFRNGDSFAYSVEVKTGTEGSGPVERFWGTPYVNVKSVDKSGEAELFVIGKLECSTLKEDGSGEKPWPGREVWLGSRIAMKPSGRGVGKEDVGARELPGYFRTLDLQPRHLIFPEIPGSVPSVEDSQGKATLFVTSTMSTGLGVALPSFGSLEGRASYAKHADALEPPFVRLTRRVSFQTDAGVSPPVKIAFQSSARFDRDLGRLRDLDATFRQEQGGGRPLVGTIRVRLLKGEALREAYEQALADWPGHPESL